MTDELMSGARISDTAEEGLRYFTISVNVFAADLLKSGEVEGSKKAHK